MGLCQEFGTQIRDGCDHPMYANPDNCSCPDCGTVCQGLFEGCPDVWERGSQPVTLAAGRASAPVVTPPRGAGRGAAPNGATTPWAKPGTNGGAGGRRPSSNKPTIVGGRGGPARPVGRSSPLDGPRDDVIEWFEEAFEGLREELHSLATGMTQQEAMVAELLDTRQGELRLVLVAEALPDLVADAVRQAMADHLAGVSETFDSVLGQFRQEQKRNKKATDATVQAVRDSLSEALASVATSIDAHTKELRESEVSRARGVKASVARQVVPLASSVDDSTARVSSALALLGRKLDRLSAAVEKGVPPGTSVAEPKAAKAVKPKTTRTPKTTAKTRNVKPLSETKLSDDEDSE